MTAPAPLTTGQADRLVTALRQGQTLDDAVEALRLDLSAVWARARTDARLTIALAGQDPDAFDERARIARADYLRLLALGVAPSREELILGSGRAGARPTRSRLTAAVTLNDTKALEPIHQALRRRESLPKRHYLDSGYRSAELIVGSAKTYGVALVTPVLLDTSRQAKAREGFAADDCTIDWPAQQATCPAGKTSAT
ncbi:hypothetical protein ACWDA7_47170 [Streptomyces sp. NPDC001156]